MPVIVEFVFFQFMDFSGSNLSQNVISGLEMGYVKSENHNHSFIFTFEINCCIFEIMTI